MGQGLQSAIEFRDCRLMFPKVGLNGYRQGLTRRGLQFAFHKLYDVTDRLHLLDFFRRKLQMKILLYRQYEVQMLNRVPVLNGVRGRHAVDLIRRDREEVRCQCANLIEDG